MKKIELVNGGHVLVDDADWELVSQHQWRCHEPVKGYPYAFYGEHRRTVFLHRLIMGAAAGQQVDHINGNGLDCRRANLRICDAAQNQWNSKLRSDNRSGFKGVHAQSPDGKWTVTIKVRGRLIYLGHYDNVDDAARAYDRAARAYHGEFALCNQDLHSSTRHRR